MRQRKRKSTARLKAMPGSAVPVGKNPPTATQLLVHIYDNKNYQKMDTFEPKLIHQALAKNQHVWIDVVGLADTQQITDICTEFAIHPLIIEDILTIQRPKLDDLGDSLFIIFNILDQTTNHLTYSTEQFSMVLKKNLLFSFRQSTKYKLSSLYKRLDSKEPIVREQGSRYITYLILDCIIDGYFNFVEEGDQAIEKIENLLVKSPPSINLTNLYTMKRRTMTLRKVIAPLRDIIHVLVAEHQHLIEPKYLLYYRDLLDHSSRLLDSIDLHREMLNGILEIYLSTLNTRMNETMKVLTVFASLFIPLTFIVGIYGMNFVYMPELKWRYSYPAVLLFMLALAICMLFYFKRKKLL